VNGASYYIVYRSDSKSDEFTEIYDALDTSYTDSGLAADTMYYIQSPGICGWPYQRLLRRCLRGDYRLASPTDLTTNAASSTQINLSWSAANGATRYYIYRAASEDGTYTELANTASTSYSNTGL